MTPGFESRYVVEEKISEGSFGVILRVREQNTGTILAAKVFEEEEWTTPSDDEEETTMSPTALRELSFMQLLTRAGAPHVARVLDFAFELGEYMALTIFMPLYRGDLSDAIEDRRLGERARLCVACDVVKALAFLHECSPPIAHRDVKPENVLLDENDRGFLTDFGFACFTGDYFPGDRTREGRPKRRDERRRRKRRGRARPSSASSSASSHPSHSGVLGTTTYIAPEVLADSYPHPSADAWALGVLLLELYENERLDADTDAQAVRLLARKRDRLEERFLLQRLLRALLQEDPLKRQTVPKTLAKLRGAGLGCLKPFFREACPRPASFPEAEGLVVSPESERLCQELRAVVPETAQATELFCSKAPDMDPRVLAMVAAKVHEHRPRGDESMVLQMGLDIEALEDAQEELLRRTRGSLLMRAVVTDSFSPLADSNRAS